MERAPWWSGFWERLIRSTKDALRKVLGLALLSFEELGTVLTEIEAILNSRPLTYVSDEVNDLDVLTPAYLLIGNKLTRFPDEKDPKIENLSVDHVTIKKRHIYKKRLIDIF